MCYQPIIGFIDSNNYYILDSEGITVPTYPVMLSISRINLFVLSWQPLNEIHLHKWLAIGTKIITWPLRKGERERAGNTLRCCLIFSLSLPCRVCNLMTSIIDHIYLIPGVVSSGLPCLSLRQSESLNIFLEGIMLSRSHDIFWGINSSVQCRYDVMPIMD